MLSENTNDRQESETLRDQLNIMQNKMDSMEHQYKKSLLEVKTDLEFQRNRAISFQEKYKTAIRYKNQEENLKKILNELDSKLSQKENQIIQLMKAEQDKKKKINQLISQIEMLKGFKAQNQELKSQLAQIQEAAVSAIVQKDDNIKVLQQRLQQYEEVGASVKNLKEMIVDLQQRNTQLEEKIERQRLQSIHMIEAKDQELKDIEEKLENLRDRSEDRITRLEQEIVQYEKHIEKINEEKYQEENIEEKYYLTEDKLRKTQKKLHDNQIVYQDKIQTYQEAIHKLENQINSNKDQLQEIKTVNIKIRELQKQNKIKKREFDELNTQFQRSKSQNIKKISTLETQKKKLAENCQSKNQEIQKLKLQLQDRKSVKGSLGQLPELSPQKSQTQQNSEAYSPKKISRKDIDEANIIIQKLKGEIKDREQNIDILSKKIEEQNKEIQEMRQRIVSSLGSASRSETQAKLMVQIEDLNSHIKKMENNLMINKLKNAEDQNYWTSKEIKLNKQIEEIQKQFKKEKAELFQRIDRMKKNTKDKKMDYYQSSLK